ncbi:hypothetical protein F0562_019243 [Nyssa sinensis]|uniref:Uncharacterized protein n=1 Tax=Nyssa sinensis TaxID=561372 RepID=A0A5J4ZE39_9ASTE|nr:hypothetical protein F0562_019243 [Nyssa sinensis]
MPWTAYSRQFCGISSKNLHTGNTSWMRPKQWLQSGRSCSRAHGANHKNHTVETSSQISSGKQSTTKIIAALQ